MKIGATLALFVTLMCAVQFNGHANVFEKNYLLLAPGLNDVSVLDSSASEAGVSLAFGTEIHPQWYAEVGYTLISADFEPPIEPLSINDVQLDSGADASGLYLSFLGKATGQSGELFYKLGVMTMTYETSNQYSGEQACDDGEQRLLTIADGTVTQCDYDDTAIAGIVGAGFDFFVGYRAQIRFQVEHIRGENDIQVNAVQLGYRYNF